MLTSLSQRFAEEEEPHWREMERRFPRFCRARERRRRLSERTGRDEARMHVLKGYTDDFAAVVVSSAGMTRYLAKHGRHFGPAGCNVTMAIAAKRHLGVSIPFLGASALTVGQLAYVTRDKQLRTLHTIAEAIAGQLILSEWVKMVGLVAASLQYAKPHRLPASRRSSRWARRTTTR